MGAHAVAIDIDPRRLEALDPYGLALAIDSSATDPKTIRKTIREFMQERGTPSWRLRIFEASGHPAGQALAFGLLGHGAVLSVVGYTAKTVEIRLSNLMAFDAVAMGNWGCLPEHYPAVVDLALSGRIAIEPFIERRPLGEINDVFDGIRRRGHGGGGGHGGWRNRVVLIPERHT
jgi:6-hydroxycyclohex-1-ene-1-carbonyl-CoA dehydrogenase